MAVSIFFEYEEKHENPEITASKTIQGMVAWTTKEVFPSFNPGTKILQMTADGEELDFITIRFNNLPSCIGFSIWSGEWADFIYKNLLYSLNK
jgi:hypothetical protein